MITAYVALRHPSAKPEKPEAQLWLWQQKYSVGSVAHLAFLDQEEHPYGPAFGADAEQRTFAHPPVFLHCGWRTRGTWVWDRFRKTYGVAGYYARLPMRRSPGSVRAGWRRSPPKAGHPAMGASTDRILMSFGRC